MARPPISGYYVGAVAMGGSGAVYIGVNVEFPRSALNNSIHAEQCLLINALRHGERRLTTLAVSAAPCGHCRQFYAELNDVESVEFLFGADARPKRLADLLPERFGPADLQRDGPFPLLLEEQHHPLALTAPARAALAERGDDAALQRAAAAALAAAQQCYAPYTRCYSGAALITRAGAVAAGGYVENAAYNPSLSPFHAAVVDAITGNVLPSFDQVTEVVLVQCEGAAVDHAANCALLLASVAPGARLTLLTATPSSSSSGAGRGQAGDGAHSHSHSHSRQPS